MRFVLKGAVLWLVLVLSSANLWAHETWLEPSSFAGAIGEPFCFDLTSGMNFPKLEYAIRPERVVTAQTRMASQRLALPTGKRGGNSLRFKQSFAQPGLAAVWVVLGPKRLDLTDAKVAEYFAEIDAPRAVREAWAKQKGRRPWRETYTKCAKTFVQVGPVSGARAAETPVGMPLEIVPLRSPTEWKTGAKIELQLLENGQPLPALALGLLVEGSDQRQFQTTDSHGRCAFVLARPAERDEHAQGEPE